MPPVIRRSGTSVGTPSAAEKISSARAQSISRPCTWAASRSKVVKRMRKRDSLSSSSGGCTST
jgi:hypothetical protein